MIDEATNPARRLKWPPRAALVLLGLSAAPAPAAVVTDAVYSGTELAYTNDVSTSDLLHGLTSTATGWSGGAQEIHDGVHGRNFYDAGGTEGGSTKVGATAEYNLGPGPNGEGWDITNIQSIAAWVGAGFGNQGWTLEVKPKDAGSYTTIATVEYQPLGSLGAGATKVALSEDITGVLAVGVEYLKVTANEVNDGANNGAFVWRELDVFGRASVYDGNPPIGVGLSPANNATSVRPRSQLTVTFNKFVLVGSGNITIKNLDTPSQRVIPVTNAQVSVSGAALTITPSPALDPHTRYAVQVAAGAVTDLSGRPFAGILDDVTWRFTTGAVLVRKVFLLGGQSNMVGQPASSGLPTSPVDLQQPQADVLFYYSGASLTALRPGSGGLHPPSGNHFGPEVTFGRAMADASPNEEYAIIKHGENGTALYNDWAPATGSSYTAFRATVDAGLAALQALGDPVEIVGMLWHQGESDAIEGQQANYEANLTAFIADVRSRYGADLPFLIGEIRRNGAAITVADAQVAVAAADPHAGFVPTSDLTFQDGLHFDAAGQMALGERFAAGYAALTEVLSWSGMGVSSITATSALAYATLGGTNASVTLYWKEGVANAPFGHTGWDGSSGPAAASTGRVERAMSGLTADTTYTSVFHATNSVDSIEAWKSTTFATDLTAAQTPAFTSAVAVGDTVTLGWQDKAATETGYLLQRSTSGDNGPYSAVVTLSMDMSTYVDGGLSSGTYHYRLAATNDLNRSATGFSACQTNVVVVSIGMPVFEVMAEGHAGTATSSRFVGALKARAGDASPLGFSITGGRDDLFAISDETNLVQVAGQSLGPVGTTTYVEVTAANAVTSRTLRIAVEVIAGTPSGMILIVR